jgi:hypothetical protein
MATSDVVPRIWFKDFTYYAICFVIWGTVFSFLQFVTSEQLAGTNFWAVKVQQAILGGGFGVICAMLFTVIQNGINRARTKLLSWILAIITWLAVSLLVSFSAGRFG